MSEPAANGEVPIGFAPVVIALLCPLDLASAVAWSLAVVAGAVLAGRRPLRWGALGWIAHAVTGAPLAGVSAAGTATAGRPGVLAAAALAPFAALVWPAPLQNAGAVLLVVAVAAAALKKSTR